MTDSPRTVSRARKLARKVVPLRARKVFVTTVDTRLKKEGKHHKVAPVSRLIAEQEAAEAAAWRESRP